MLKAPEPVCQQNLGRWAFRQGKSQRGEKTAKLVKPVRSTRRHDSHHIRLRRGLEMQERDMEETIEPSANPVDKRVC